MRRHIIIGVLCGACGSASGNMGWIDGGSFTGPNGSSTGSSTGAMAHDASTNGSGSGGSSGSVGGSSSSGSSTGGSNGSSGGRRTDSGAGSGQDGSTAADASGPQGPPPTLYQALPYRGLSLSGAEFAANTDGTFLGNTYGTIPGYYFYPDTLVTANTGSYPNGYGKTAYPFYIGKGMNTFRLPFRWERLQRTMNGDFDTNELSSLQSCVTDMINAGAVVLLDAHNYARYATASQISGGQQATTVGVSALPNSGFADFWKRLATLYANNSHVIFDLMNEPEGLSDNQVWPAAAQAAVTAIRSAGANNLILIEGNSWSDAQSWPMVSDALKSISDPANNFAFEVHNYPDDAGGGAGDTCSDVNEMVTALTPFTAWLHTNHARGFLGEFSAGTTINASQGCMTAIDNGLKYLTQNSDVYIGWTYWAGGPGWNSDNPMEYSVLHKDSPQMTVLLKYLQ